MLTITYKNSLMPILSFEEEKYYNDHFRIKKTIYQEVEVNFKSHR